MPTLEKLYKHTDTVGKCFIWNGGFSPEGQPKCNSTAWGTAYARQAAYQLAGNDLKKGQTLYCICLNPKCIRAEHLSYKQPISQLFSEFIEQIDSNGPVPVDSPWLGKCHLWKGCDNKGRAVVNKDKWGEYHTARWIYKLINNLSDIDSFTTINHLCNNPLCVNPSHLYHSLEDESWNKSNMNQAIEQKRLYNQKFTPAEVKDVRRRILEGAKTKDLCAEFKCSKPTIADIKYNRRFYDASYTPPES